MKKNKMKKNGIIVALMLGAFSLSATGCSNNKNTPEDASVVKTEKEVAITSPSEAAKKVTFRKGKLIEVAFLSVKEGKQKQLNEDYFAKIMPIAAEYGLKPLMTIAVKNTITKDMNCQMVGFFEWPNAAKKEAFEKDKRFIELRKIRTDALSFLKIGFFEVEKDMEVILDNSKVYEVYAMSMNKEKGHLMQKYFEKAGPICTNNYDVDFALSMTPVNVSMGHELFVPQTFGIAIWPNEEANKKYFNSKEYKKIKHFKEDALEKLDVWEGTVILQ